MDESVDIYQLLLVLTTGDAGVDWGRCGEGGAENVGMTSK